MGLEGMRPEKKANIQVKQHLHVQSLQNCRDTAFRAELIEGKLVRTITSVISNHSGSVTWGLSLCRHHEKYISKSHRGLT